MVKNIDMLVRDSYNLNTCQTVFINPHAAWAEAEKVLGLFGPLPWLVEKVKV